MLGFQDFTTNSYPSAGPNTPTAGNVGVGHQTGNSEVDSLLNQIDGFVADTRSWLGSFFKDPLTGMPANSQSTFDSQVNSALGEAQALLAGGGELLNSTGNGASMVSLFQSIGQDVSTILNPNTTDAQLNQINSKNQRAEQIYGNYAKLGEMENNNNQWEQRLNEHRLDSYRTFGTGPDYADNGWDWKGYWGLDGSYWSYEDSSYSSSDSSYSSSDSSYSSSDSSYTSSDSSYSSSDNSSSSSSEEE